MKNIISLAAAVPPVHILKMKLRRDGGEFSSTYLDIEIKTRPDPKPLTNLPTIIIVAFSISKKHVPTIPIIEPSIKAGFLPFLIIQLPKNEPKAKPTTAIVLSKALIVALSVVSNKLNLISRCCSTVFIEVRSKGAVIPARIIRITNPDRYAVSP